MENLKDIVAKNLADFRKQAKLTQLELANKLNFSDKSISKWERGESIPDVETLKNLADLYEIKVDDFLCEHKSRNIIKNLPLNIRRLLISLLFSVAVWAVATAVFVVLTLLEIQPAWLAFIYAIPTTLIVTLIFSIIWGGLLPTAIICTLIVWTVPLTIFLTVAKSSLWMLFLICIPIQILIVIWFIYMLVKQRNSNIKTKMKNSNPAKF